MRSLGRAPVYRWLENLVVKESGRTRISEVAKTSLVHRNREGHEFHSRQLTSHQEEARPQRAVVAQRHVLPCEENDGPTRASRAGIQLGTSFKLQTRSTEDDMKITDLLLAELDREAVGIRKTLERIPEGKKSWHSFSAPRSARQSRPERLTMQRKLSRFLLHCCDISTERSENGSHRSPICGGIMANVGKADPHLAVSKVGIHYDSTSGCLFLIPFLHPPTARISPAHSRRSDADRRSVVHDDGPCG